MKKLQMGIIILVVCFLVAVSGCSSNNKTSSSNTSSSSDVNIVVNYPGTWVAELSGTWGYRSVEGSGDQKINLGNISGVVSASVRKKDGSSDTLKVQITKNGQTLSSASTSYPYAAASAVATV